MTARALKRVVSGELLERAADHLEAAGTLLADLEGRPGDAGLVNELFLAVRGLKGAAAMAGIKRARPPADALEQALARVRLGTLAVDHALLDSLRLSLAELADLLADVDEDAPEPPLPEEEPFAEPPLPEEEPFAEPPLPEEDALAEPPEPDDGAVPDEMFQDFLGDSRESLERLEALLDRLGGNPGDKELLSEFFRLVHTLGGTAAFVDMDAIKDVAHEMERVFTALRRGEAEFSPAVADAAARGLEAMARLRDEAESGRKSGVDVAEIRAGLAALLPGADGAPGSEPELASVCGRAEDAPAPDMDEEDLEDLDAKLLAQMMEDFFAESQENLDQLSLLLTKLEENPADEELVNCIFRVAHTIKGTASFVELTGIMEVAHRLEDVFGAVRRGELEVDPDMLDVMFQAVQLLAALRDKAMDQALPEPDKSLVMAGLQAILHQAEPQAGVSPPGLRPAPATRPAPPPPEPQARPKPVAEPKPAPPAPGTSTCPLPGGMPAGHMVAETIRVPTERLDGLMNLVGELITSRNRLNELAELFKREELTSVASGISRLTGQLHYGLLSVRMVPIGRLFNKFPGVVRNLARERNKQVELLVSGKETELDKTVIEQIHDPLVHLLRNAVDHGIESPEERRAKGKPEKGRISLDSRHQQDNVIIEIEDDGAGIDPERIKAKAVEKGIIDPEEAAAMTREEAVRLIFMPGFSTAENVSEISGRGVGMDVVKSNIQGLRGMVDVKTAPGRGALFRVQLPLTLAIMQVLLVRVGELIYALPLSTVMETMLVDPGEIKTMEKSEVIFIRGRALPLKKLSAILACPRSNGGPARGKALPVVVLGLAEKRVAVAVDELLGKQEVVMKSLGEYLGRVRGIEGASVLPDGSVTLIVDVATALG